MPSLFAAFPGDGRQEQFEELLCFTRGKVARIRSLGHVSPPGFWYEETKDEWVAVLAGEGEIEWPDGRRRRLKSGEWLILPAGERHRVSYTSSPCVWLAIYGDMGVQNV